MKRVIVPTVVLALLMTMCVGCSSDMSEDADTLDSVEGLEADEVTEAETGSDVEELVEQTYVEADLLLCQEDYLSAGQLFYNLGDYKDSVEKYQLCENYYLYKIGCTAQNAGDYDLAYQYFTVIGSFLDSEERLNQCRDMLRENTVDISYYLSELNTYSCEDNNEITLTPTAFVNIERVNLGTIEGTVKYTLVDGGRAMIMTWRSNQECGYEELIAVRNLLRDSFSYGDYFVEDADEYEAYYWENINKNNIEYDTVLCVLEYDHLAVKWLKSIPIAVENNSEKTTIPRKRCESCDNDATKELEIFGRSSQLCDYHYNECMTIIDKIESDVGSGAYSTHHCEECNKEGVRSIIGISGQLEYYCTEHYEEIKELWEGLQN